MFVLLSQFLQLLSTSSVFKGAPACPPSLFGYRVSELDEPGRLNIAAGTSCLRSQMGIPERESACQFHQDRDNPREETAFLLACVSLRRQDHQFNKSVMPLSVFSLSLYLRPSLTYSFFFYFLNLF